MLVAFLLCVDIILLGTWHGMDPVRRETKELPSEVSDFIYYPPEVRRGEYWGLGVFLMQYFPFVKI